MDLKIKKLYEINFTKFKIRGGIGINKNFQKILNNIYILLILFFVCVIFPKLYFNIDPDNRIKSKSVIQISKDVVLTSDDSSEKKLITLPERIKTTKPFSIKVVLAKYDYEERSIGMLTNYTDYDISIDGQMFYKSESPKFTMPKSNGGQIYTIINLPKKIKNPIMTINYYPKLNFETRYSIESIDLGNRDDFFINMLEKDFPILSLVFLMFMLFLVSMVISVSSYSSGVFENSIFYVGMSLLLTGMYFLTKTKTVIYLLSEKRAIIYFLDYGPFMSMIYPVLKLIQHKIRPIFSKMVGVAVRTLELTYIVELILTVTRISEFKELLSSNLILNFIYGLLIAVSLIFSIDRKNKDSILLAISVIPLFVNLAIGITSFNANNTINLTSILIVNTLIFVILQIYMFSQNYQRIKDENTKSEIYREMIEIDALTSVNNRYSFEQKIKQIKEKPKKHIIITADLNNLKMINDFVGHDAGDKAIKGVSQYLKENLPSSTVYRTGGDEFMVICDGKYDTTIIDNIKNIVNVPTVSDKIEISFSIGYAIYDPKGELSLEEVIKLSDKNMYEDKIKNKKIKIRR